jgi:agmatinase
VPLRSAGHQGELLDAVRRIAMEVPLAGVDVVEGSPPYDHAEITAYLGNRTVLEALSGIAWRRRRSTGEAFRKPDDPLLKRDSEPAQSDRV